MKAATTRSRSRTNRKKVISISERLLLRENDFLSFIGSFTKEHGYAPSYEEIRESLGLRSKGSVFNMMRKLSDDGKIVFQPKRARTLRVV